MGKIADACIDTTHGWVLYRDFIIAEAYDTKTHADVWEWTHQNFLVKADPNCGVTGNCRTLFECIDAVDAWHEANDAGQTAPQESR